MKQITNPDNNMWRSTDQPQRRICGQIITGGLLKNAPESGWIALRDAFVKQ